MGRKMIKVFAKSGPGVVFLFKIMYPRSARQEKKKPNDAHQWEPRPDMSGRVKKKKKSSNQAIKHSIGIIHTPTKSSLRPIKCKYMECSARTFSAGRASFRSFSARAAL
jgi:hypothetical protein